jgi:hypothetical protein
MTVRQLEALIRISESFARMSLAAEADDGHVAAAFDLFTKSTINAMNAGLINSTERLEVSVWCWGVHETNYLEIERVVSVEPCKWQSSIQRVCVFGGRDAGMSEQQFSCKTFCGGSKLLQCVPRANIRICAAMSALVQASETAGTLLFCLHAHLTASALLLPLQVSATQDVEARVCERLHIGGHVSYRRLLEDMAGLGYSNQQVRTRRGACVF